MPSSRQLVAIMFTDIVGYTALMGKDEQRAVAILEQNRLLQKPLIEQYGGRWIKELGDGVLASFTTVSDAVQCAVDIQNTCNQGQEFRLRIGIHQGEVMFENNDVFGDAVNLASRIQAIAPVGGIWVSEAVHHNIVNKQGMTTQFVKVEKLKNVAEPVRIYDVRLDAVQQVKEQAKNQRRTSAWPATLRSKKVIWPFGLLFFLLAGLLYVLVFRHKPSSPSSQGDALEKSIAVLYFDNMSGDPAQDYFSDGITEEIIAKLSHLSNLRVISRTSVLPYKGKAANIKDIARELNCSNILEGSVRKSGNKLRITAQLIDAAADRHVWSQTFDRELTDIFAIQSSVAESVAAKFNLPLSPQAQAQINYRPTKSVEAYDLYLQAKAIAFRNQGIGVGNPVYSRNQATAYLQQAITFDPSYSEAMALLSQMYYEIYYTKAENKLTLDSARLLAQRAIAANPNVVDGYLALMMTMRGSHKDDVLALCQRLYRADSLAGINALGTFYYDQGNLVEAMKYFSQQIRNEPNKVGGYRSKAIIYNRLGKKDSAIRYFNMATSLDPNDNQTLLHLAEFYMFKGEVQAAVKIAKLAYAGDVMAYNKAVAIAYLYARDWQQAEAYYRKTDYRDMDYALVLWKTNRQDSARVYFKKAIDYRNSLPSNYGMDLSRIYAVLGNQKEAIQNLQLGFSLGWHWYDWVKRDPYWDEIRSTPEFKNEEQHFDQRNRAMLSQINDNEKRGVLPDLRFAQ